MTNGISINAGFEFGSAQPVDSRLVLTNSEMLHADTNIFPDPYFAINADDRFLYIYSSNNTYSETTGYFKKYTSDGGKAQWYGTESEYQALPVETQSDTSIVFYRYGSDSEKNYVVSDHSIKQEVYMSESDYQELETKDSDTMYATETGIRIGENYVATSNSLSYSTNEVLTGGTWIDGKPIYRKVIELPSLPNNSQVSIAHNITNVESFITVRGIAFNPTSTLSLPIPFVERNGQEDVQLYATATDYVISVNYDASAYTGKIILEYTKTTD